jgi:hypothetical protein
MNANLQTLLEESTRKYDRLGNEIPFAQPDLELFAELIIRKCVVVGNYAYDGGEYPGPMIKDYFGIK